MTTDPTRPRPASFPAGITDRDGRQLRPGSLVTALSGQTMFEIAEIVGWWRGTEVLVVPHRHDDALAPQRVVDASELVKVDLRAGDATTIGTFMVGEPASTVLVLPVGAQDIQVAAHGDLGPFPPPSEFTSPRVTREQTDARRWGEACLAALEGRSEAEGAALVAAHLDAPILRRALVEALLPGTLSRLVLLVTDQGPTFPGDPTTPHRDDTAAFGRLLALWLQAAPAARRRPIEEVAAPIVIRHRPDLLDSVVHTVRGELDRVTRGVEVAAVVQAGGTPAMPFGALLAFAASGRALRTRHITVPYGAPIVEVDFPAVIGAASVAAALRASGGGPVPAGHLQEVLDPERGRDRGGLVDALRRGDRRAARRAARALGLPPSAAEPDPLTGRLAHAFGRAWAAADLEAALATLDTLVQVAPAALVTARRSGVSSADTEPPTRKELRALCPYADWRAWVDAAPQLTVRRTLARRGGPAEVEEVAELFASIAVGDQHLGRPAEDLGRLVRIWRRVPAASVAALARRHRAGSASDREARHTLTELLGRTPRAVPGQVCSWLEELGLPADAPTLQAAMDHAYPAP